MNETTRLLVMDLADEVQTSRITRIAHKWAPLREPNGLWKISYVIMKLQY